MSSHLGSLRLVASLGRHEADEGVYTTARSTRPASEHTLSAFDLSQGTVRYPSVVAVWSYLT